MWQWYGEYGDRCSECKESQLNNDYRTVRMTYENGRRLFVGNKILIVLFVPPPPPSRRGLAQLFGRWSWGWNGKEKCAERQVLRSLLLSYKFKIKKLEKIYLPSCWPVVMHEYIPFPRQPGQHVLVLINTFLNLKICYIQNRSFWTFYCSVGQELLSFMTSDRLGASPGSSSVQLPLLYVLVDLCIRIVTCISIARQQVDKHFPAETDSGQ
jgi:hypothetical protein